MSSARFSTSLPLLSRSVHVQRSTSCRAMYRSGTGFASSPPPSMISRARVVCANSCSKSRRLDGAASVFCPHFGPPRRGATLSRLGFWWRLLCAVGPPRVSVVFPGRCAAAPPLAPSVRSCLFSTTSLRRFAFFSTAVTCCVSSRSRLLCGLSTGSAGIAARDAALPSLVTRLIAMLQLQKFCRFGLLYRYFEFVFFISHG
mmetsp:Transcript_19467/g.48780  ORF Transcript_19467/g.48780 Transcript_19467/m.48780 type:complete len:201 (-) Transcript_19467:200-802(-)